jgi:hypothetical protein
MAVLSWQVVAQVNCGRATPAKLLEERVYPADFLVDTTGAFRVQSRHCAKAAACRAANVPCRWTGLNPNYDPFEA